MDENEISGLDTFELNQKQSECHSPGFEFQRIHFHCVLFCSMIQLIFTFCIFPYLYLYHFCLTGQLCQFNLLRLNLFPGQTFYPDIVIFTCFDLYHICECQLKRVFIFIQYMSLLEEKRFFLSNSKSLLSKIVHVVKGSATKNSFAAIFATIFAQMSLLHGMW